jgi:hypothetical protein
MRQILESAEPAIFSVHLWRKFWQYDFKDLLDLKAVIAGRIKALAVKEPQAIFFNYGTTLGIELLAAWNDACQLAQQNWLDAHLATVPADAVTVIRSISEENWLDSRYVSPASLSKALTVHFGKQLDTPNLSFDQWGRPSNDLGMAQRFLAMYRKHAE